MKEKFSLLPHIRSHVAINGLVTGSRLNLTYTLQVTANGQKRLDSVPVSAELRGPGDIIGINSSAIARIEPTPGLRGFEASYFPLIEFVDPDYPWRYSLDTDENKGKIPWIALLALKDTEFEFINQGNAPLAGIRVQNATQSKSLPDLKQAWAWAHSQVRLKNETDLPAEILEKDPANGFSRLLCCRRLQPRTSYYLFLVPTYLAGVLIGLDREATEGVFNGVTASQDAAPAWETTATNVELPYYHHSRFTTDTQEDFEALIKRLRKLTEEEKSAIGMSKKASAANPGYYNDYIMHGQTFQIQSALQHEDEQNRTGQRIDTEESLMNKMEVTLTEAISGENSENQNDNDPLVAFPVYGFRYGPDKKVDRETNERKWFHHINLDLKMRQVAAMGAKTVAENQEEMVKICWEQYEEIMEANLRILRLQTSERLAKRLISRHFDKLATDTALALSEPIQAFVLDTTKNQTITNSMRQGGIPTQYASRGLRRLAAKRPIPIQVNKRIFKGIPTPKIPGDHTPGVLSKSARLVPANFRKCFLTDSGIHSHLEKEMVPIIDNNAFEGFKRPESKTLFVKSFKSADHATVISNSLKVLPITKADFTVKGRNEKESKILAPIYRSPVIPLPLSKYLANYSKETILSGITNLPLNTVSLFCENRQFIEAFMLGANHAMNTELRWREFPTDMRGTIFRRFWNKGLPIEDERGDDITEIHAWIDKLGLNPNPSDNDNSENLVFIVRGDIIRKLDLPIITLNITKTNNWDENDIVETKEPTFLGKIDVDTAYYGFDVSRHWVYKQIDRAFFHMYETAGRFRFGLDVATVSVRIERDDYISKAIPFPMAATGKSYDYFRARMAFENDRKAPSELNSLTTWDDLSWSHMQPDSADYINFDYEFILSGTTEQYWNQDRTSASIARSFWQKPIAAVVPVGRLINA